MDIASKLAKWEDHLFVTEGRLRGRAYMVLDDMIIYVDESNQYKAEGRPIKDIGPFISQLFCLGQRVDTEKFQ